MTFLTNFPFKLYLDFEEKSIFFFINEVKNREKSKN